MIPPVWLLGAWGWLKLHWRWVLFPLGLALLVLGWMRKTKVVVHSSALTGADETARELSEVAAKKVQEATAARDVKIRDADADFEVAIGALVDRQKADAPFMAQDQEELNRALLEAGKRQRRLSQ